MSTRERIINNIETSIAGISIAGGYHNNIAFITRDSERFEHFDETTEYPIALISWDSEEKSSEEIGMWHIQSDMFVIVRGAVHDTSANLETTLNNFLEDVERALDADRTRGGEAAFTFPISISVYSSTRENVLVFDYRFQIRYYYNHGSP
jgi:hypothetical protein